MTARKGRITLRVLHVVESDAPEAGSATILVAGLVAALRRSGVESQMCAAESPTFDGVDLVHLHGWETAAAYRAAVCCRRAAVPYVVSLLGSIQSRALARRGPWTRVRQWWVDRGGLAAAAAWVVSNSAEREPITRRGGAVEQLPYGIDFDGYAGEARQRSDGLNLLVLGPIHPREGLVPLLKALAENAALAETDGQVALAGREEGPWRRMIEAAVRRRGFAERVTFVPAATVAEQRRLLAEASLVVCPSLAPRCPTSLLQAIAAGVPLLASREVLPDALSDLAAHCKPRRAEFARRLTELLSEDQTKLRNRAAQLRDAARARLDWSKLAGRYIDLYERCARLS